MDPYHVFAISDLHLNQKGRLQHLSALPSQENSILLVAGDVCENIELFELAMLLLIDRFEIVVWSPGNHDLWVEPANEQTSPQKYEALLAVCRRLGIITPNDEWLRVSYDGTETMIVPLFLLYDYGWSSALTREDMRSHAAANGLLSMDEIFLKTWPFPTVKEWSTSLIQQTETRLKASDPLIPKIFVSHFPLTLRTASVAGMESYLPWCGSPKTEPWARQFNAKIVVSGHLHRRTSTFFGETRFEEVSARGLSKASVSQVGPWVLL